MSISETVTSGVVGLDKTVLQLLLVREVFQKGVGDTGHQGVEKVEFGQVTLKFRLLEDQGSVVSIERYQVMLKVFDDRLELVK